jgi:DHA2 family metal-tetracycline-proton antiporter-like MFS transporter
VIFKEEAMSAVRVRAPANPKKLVPWIAYLIFFAVLNETVFNVSTPKIAAQFSLSPTGVSLMMTIFMVFFGVGAVIFGKLSDIFSLRSLIRTGVGIYVAASVLGFLFRSSYPAVVAARAVQGIGGSAIPALVFVITARFFDVSDRGRIFGFITSIVSLAIGFGPVIGGVVSSSLHWSYLFLIPLMILISLPFIDRELAPEPRRKGSVDVLGAALAAFDIGALVAYLNFNSLAYLAAFAVLSVLFIARILTAADPFIKPSLFSNAGFRRGLAVAFCLFAIVIGIVFLIPLMLSRVFGLSTGQIGLILFPGAISSVIFGPIAGRLADRRGSGFVIAIGLSLLVSALVILSFLLALSPLITLAAMLLIYVGFALFQTAMVNAISLALPPQDIGVGMGLFNLVSILAGAIGTALVAKILDGGWLDFAFLPLASKGFAYSNLLVVFALIALLGAALYFRGDRRAKVAVSGVEILGDSNCIEPSGC